MALFPPHFGQLCTRTSPYTESITVKSKLCVMATNPAPQYPDVLGALTSGARANVGVVQCALAVRPLSVAAGQPLELVLVVQNACDQTVDVSAQLTLPDADNKKQKGRFLTPKTKPVVAVQAGEVGYISIPVATLLDTAPGDSYKVSVEIDVKASGKPTRVRAQEGGGIFVSSMMEAAGRARLAELRTLRFHTQKALMRNSLETTFTVSGVRPGLPPDLHAKWVSLWTLADSTESLLLLQYADEMLVRTMPKLKRAVVHQALLEATRTRFADAHYPLRDAEAALIAKLMTIILEYAAPKERGHGYQAAGKYAVEPLFAIVRQNPATHVRLPHWMSAFLRLVARDARALDHIDKLVMRQLYLPLLRDAIEYGFALLSQTTGQIMGEEADIAQYADQVIACLETGEGMEFQRVYLPLAMGGALINEKILLAGEHRDEQVERLVADLDERKPEIPDEDADVLDMVQETIHRIAKVYGNRGV